MDLGNQNDVQGNGAINSPILIVDDRDCSIRQYAVGLFIELNLGSRISEIKALYFELKLVMFQML